MIGKVGTDIEENKCSWLIVQALPRINEEQREILKVTTNGLFSLSFPLLWFQMFLIPSITLVLFSIMQNYSTLKLYSTNVLVFLGKLWTQRPSLCTESEGGVQADQYGKGVSRLWRRELPETYEANRKCWFLTSFWNVCGLCKQDLQAQVLMKSGWQISFVWSLLSVCAHIHNNGYHTFSMQLMIN